LRDRFFGIYNGIGEIDWGLIKEKYEKRKL
jgi:hypothetical protein